MAGRPPFLATGLNLLTRARVSDSLHKTTKMSNNQSKMSKPTKPQPADPGYRNFSIRNSDQTPVAHAILGGKKSKNDFPEAAANFAAKMVRTERVLTYTKSEFATLVAQMLPHLATLWRNHKEDLYLVLPYTGLEFSEDERLDLMTTLREWVSEETTARGMGCEFGTEETTGHTWVALGIFN